MYLQSVYQLLLWTIIAWILACVIMELNAYDYHGQNKELFQRGLHVYLGFLFFYASTCLYQCLCWLSFFQSFLLNFLFPFFSDKYCLYYAQTISKNTFVLKLVVWFFCSILVSVSGNDYSAGFREVDSYCFVHLSLKLIVYLKVSWELFCSFGTKRYFCLLVHY